MYGPLSVPELELSRWKERLLPQVSVNGASVLDVVPDLAKRGGVDARELRARAHTDARALARVRVPYALGVSQLLHAGLAVAENRGERAATLLRAAVLQLEQRGGPSYAAAAQRRLGQLIGGEQGAALEAQAADALRAMGAVDIEATTRMFTFGIEVS